MTILHTFTLGRRVKGVAGSKSHALPHRLLGKISGDLERRSFPFLYWTSYGACMTYVCTNSAPTARSSEPVCNSLCLAERFGHTYIQYSVLRTYVLQCSYSVQLDPLEPVSDSVCPAEIRASRVISEALNHHQDRSQSRPVEAYRRLAGPGHKEWKYEGRLRLSLNIKHAARKTYTEP